MKPLKWFDLKKATLSFEMLDPGETGFSGHHWHLGKHILNIFLFIKLVTIDSS